MEEKSNKTEECLGQAVPLHASHLSYPYTEVTFLTIASLLGPSASPSSEQVASDPP